MGHSRNICITWHNVESKLPTRTNEHWGGCSITFGGPEWMLEPSVTQIMFFIYGHAEVNLLTSSWSKQVRRYFGTVWHESQFRKTAALLHSFSVKNNWLYAFPPPNLNPLVLGRVHHISSLMILIPQWWWRAPWLSVRLSHLLPRRWNTIWDLATDTRLLDQHKLHMIAWLISNIMTHPCRTAGSNLNWPVSFNLHGNPLPEHTI